MQNIKPITRVFSTLLMCQILLFSVLGKSLPIKQTHFVVAKHTTVEPAKPHVHQVFGEYRAVDEIQFDSLNIEFLSQIEVSFLSHFQRWAAISFSLFESTFTTTFPLHAILFEQFISMNAP